MKEDIPGNTDEKKAGVSIAESDKILFKTAKHNQG